MDQGFEIYKTLQPEKGPDDGSTVLQINDSERFGNTVGDVKFIIELQACNRSELLRAFQHCTSARVCQDHECSILR